MLIREVHQSHPSASNPIQSWLLSLQTSVTPTTAAGLVFVVSGSLTISHQPTTMSGPCGYNVFPVIRTHTPGHSLRHLAEGTEPDPDYTTYHIYHLKDFPKKLHTPSHRSVPAPPLLPVPRCRCRVAKLLTFTGRSQAEPSRLAKRSRYRATAVRESASSQLVAK